MRQISFYTQFMSFFLPWHQDSQDVQLVNPKSLNVQLESPKSRLYGASQVMPTTVPFKVFWGKDIFSASNNSKDKAVDGMPRDAVKALEILETWQYKLS